MYPIFSQYRQGRRQKNKNFQGKRGEVKTVKTRPKNSTN